MTEQTIAIEDKVWPRELRPDPIAEVERYIRRFCVLPEPAYLPMATWCVATFLSPVFECFPYLALLSPAKRCGKTRLLEVLEVLCKRPWRGTAPTAAALFRMMETEPTLLLDEVEMLNRRGASENQQTILAILNAGHRRGATVPRCIGKDHKLHHFAVYGPKAFAAIGKLPDTLADRSIAIIMQRRTAAQLVERFLLGQAKANAAGLVEMVSRWAEQEDENVRAAYQTMPDLKFLSDRDADLWMPLFAVCSIASPHRLADLRNYAISLSGAKEAHDTEDSPSLRLLSDIREIWPKGAAHMSSADLLGRLKELEESPWSEYDLTARKLSKWLGPFDVASRSVRTGAATPKGYVLADLQPSFDRYLPAAAATSATTHLNTGHGNDLRNATAMDVADPGTSSTSHQSSPVAVVADKEA